jgi:hypothetical protein
LIIRFQADADLNHTIVTAVRQREPAIDFASAADAGLEGIPDPEILDRAARDGRILVTHDRRTMILHARNRMVSRQECAGIVIVPQFTAVRDVAEALVLIWTASHPAEWRDRIVHVPSLATHILSR